MPPNYSANAKNNQKDHTQQQQFLDWKILEASTLRPYVEEGFGDRAYGRDTPRLCRQES